MWASEEFGRRVRELIARGEPPMRKGEPGRWGCWETFAERGMLMLGCDAAYCYAVMPDGQVVSYDVDRYGPPIEPEENQRRAYEMLMMGAELYPELKELIPKPPALHCLTCSATLSFKNAYMMFGEVLVKCPECGAKNVIGAVLLDGEPLFDFIQVVRISQW